MQAADGDDGPARRGRREGLVLVVARPQGDQERRDVGLRDLAQVVASGAAQVGGVAVEVTAVGAERVGREPPLDREVVEVGLDRAPDRRLGAGGRRGGRAQTSASDRADTGRPCASPTGADTSCPLTVFTPRARAGSASAAARSPRLAISTAYGSVTFVSA